MKDQNAQDNRLVGNLMYIKNNNPHPGRCQMRKPVHEHAAIGDTLYFSPAEIHNTSMPTLSTIISGITSKAIKTFSEKEAERADAGGIDPKDIHRENILDDEQEDGINPLIPLSTPIFQ